MGEKEWVQWMKEQKRLITVFCFHDWDETIEDVPLLTLTRENIQIGEEVHKDVIIAVWYEIDGHKVESRSMFRDKALKGGAFPGSSTIRPDSRPDHLTRADVSEYEAAQLRFYEDVDSGKRQAGTFGREDSDPIEQWVFTCPHTLSKFGRPATYVIGDLALKDLARQMMAEGHTRLPVRHLASIIQHKPA